MTTSREAGLQSISHAFNTEVQSGRKEKHKISSPNKFFGQRTEAKLKPRRAYTDTSTAHLAAIKEVVAGFMKERDD